MFRTLILGLVAASSFLVPARAAILFDGRSIVATINASKADFSDAVLTVDATTFVGAGSTGTRQLDFVPLAGFESGTVTTTGDVTLSNYVVTPSGGSGEVGATGAGSFTFHNVYATGVDDPYADATLIRYADGTTALPPFEHTGLPLLEFYTGVGGGGLIDEGTTFSFSLIIPGDYSATAGLSSGPGQHYEDSLSFDGFTIAKDYLYDPVSNTTTLSLVNTAFEPGQFVGVDTYFVGSSLAPVPEPATWLTAIIGFGMTGLLLRRSREMRAIRIA